MMAVAPASMRMLGPSAKGKKASEAATDPGNLSACPFSFASHVAIRQLITRDICPAPLPMSIPSLQTEIALLVVWVAGSQANLKSEISDSVGLRLVTTFH